MRAPAAPAGEASADGRSWELDGSHPFRADLRKYYRICFQSEAPALAQRLRLWATHFGLHCVAVYRFERLVRRLDPRLGWICAPLALLAGLLGHLLELVHHVRIYADIGPGLYIGHAGMIFVGPTVIGRNFSMTHNVTIGFGHADGAKGFPVVGDDVWVGTGSVLSGAIRVGDGATVANGTMLSRSVPARSLSAGNPGRVVLASYDNASLLGELRPAGQGGAAPAPRGEDPLHADPPSTSPGAAWSPAVRCALPASAASDPSPSASAAG